MKRLRVGYELGFDVLLECLAFDVLEDQVEGLVGLVEAKYFDKVGMVKASENADFVFNSETRLWVGFGVAFEKSFDGNFFVI